MHRGQIMVGGRQQVKTDGNPFRRTHQMQPPAEELLVFGGTVTAEFPSPHFLAAPSTHALTDGQRQTVNDEGFSMSKHLPNQSDHPVEPFAQCVQLPVEARDAQAVDVTQRHQQAQRTLMMVLKIFGCDHCHCQDLRRMSACSAVIFEAPRFQNVINHHIRRYNVGVVHVALSLLGCVVTPILASSA